MKLTKEYLKKIIREEIRSSLDSEDEMYEAESQWDNVSKDYKNLVNKSGLKEKFMEMYKEAKENASWSGTTPKGERVMLKALDALETGE